MNPYVNIHTHHVGEGINILDVGEGKAWVEGEEKRKSVEGQEVFYSVGVHPMKLDKLGENVFTGIEDTARMEKVIAIVRFGPSLSYLHGVAGEDTGSSSWFGGKVA